VKKNNIKDLNLIGIHASILSIIIAFFAAYGFFVFGNLDELEYRAFSEYSKINDIELTFKYRSPRHQFKHLLDIPPKSQYQPVLDQIWNIAITDLMNTMYDDKKRVIENAELGIQLLCNMTVLQNIFPYATRISFDTDGNVLDKKNIDKIEISSLDNIRNWLKDIDKVLQNTMFIYSYRKGKLDELITSASLAIEKKMPPFESENELAEKYTPGDKKDILSWRKTIAPSLVNKFFQNIGETQKIFMNTKKIIDDYDLYNNRHINRTVFSIGLILTFLAFTVSVIFPLIFNSVPKLFDIWIPVSVYLIIFLFLIFEIVLI